MKLENIFVVEQTHTRKYDLDEMLFFRMDEATALPVVSEAPLRYVMENGIKQLATSQPGNRLPPMNREWLIFDEHNKPHPKVHDLFYEALKAGPLHYYDPQRKVQTLLNCGTQMWNSMFRQMRSSGAIVRGTNSIGQSMWQLPVKEAEQKPQEPELFDWDAADLGQTLPPLSPL